jgi:hypothetical protein
MKSTVYIVILFSMLNCDSMGPDKNFPLSSGSKYLFEEGEILSYVSGTAEEKYEVKKIVNGLYEDSQSGTCAKPRLFIYEYQVVYLKPVDTLDRDFYYISERQTDCSPYFIPRDELISSINISYDGDTNNRITWMTEFSDRISNFTEHHATLTLGNHEFEDVFEYNVPIGKRLSTLYYNRRKGFVGYTLDDGSTFSLDR